MTLVAAPGSTGETGPGPTPRRRRKRRPSGPDLAAGLIFAMAGALFVAGASASRDGALRVDGTGNLRDAISARADQNAELQGQIDVLQARVDALQRQTDPGPALAATLAQIAELSPAVGLTEVRGPGITVTLDDADAPTPIPEGMTGDDYLVHEEDVQGVVNALWRGGASGVTVMGQRLISSSAVRCVGNTVILQGRVHSPPFVIQGVGDIEELEAALDADESVQFFRAWAQEVGLGYEQVAARELVLPPYTGPISPKHATVLS